LISFSLPLFFAAIKRARESTKAERKLASFANNKVDDRLCFDDADFVTDDASLFSPKLLDDETKIVSSTEVTLCSNSDKTSSSTFSSEALPSLFALVVVVGKGEVEAEEEGEETTLIVCVPLSLSLSLSL
tara:strand:- start:338 stop:727 length:390 start_codon:yes stop_codon:yes gene_type:complete